MAPRSVVDSNGVIVKVKDDIVSIPSEIDHMLKDRESWERDFKHRLQYSESRINLDALAKIPRPEERGDAFGHSLWQSVWRDSEYFRSRGDKLCIL
ncbi:MAG: hypothetical protein ACLR23_17590 [Clostridia bacterium]